MRAHFSSIALLVFLLSFNGSQEETSRFKPGAAYHVDSNNGNDNNDGLSVSSAWQSIDRLQKVVLLPGDSVKFKRGSSFDKPYYVYQSGQMNNYIVLTDYGAAHLPGPKFTNAVFTRGNWANCIRVHGSYIIIENLHCYSTSAYVRGDYTVQKGWDTAIWHTGAIYLDKTASNCIVRNNELEDCVVGIKSYGPFAKIENNYIHDCNRVLKEFDWGPIGIWLGADNQEVYRNRIFNIRAEDDRIFWNEGVGGKADGGAIEIDDARFDKRNISIHHNYTRDCQGFLEVTWTDIKQHPDYDGFAIHHNISDDYQQFVAIWNGKNCLIENNTIIRRKKNGNDWGVFNITQENSKNQIRNNIIITEKDIPIFNTGLRMKRYPRNIIEHNLYFAASGKLVMGNEGPGVNPVFGDPMLRAYPGSEPADFGLRKGSSAIDKGIACGHLLDFQGAPVAGGCIDIGAFEFNNSSRVEKKLKTN